MLKSFTRFTAFGWLALMAMAAPALCGATNYYIDYKDGSDAADGISTNTPWKHCPGDPAATGRPATNGLAPGDTVYFKGGVQYILSFPGIELNWDGAPGKPITYDGNSAQNWGGTNRAIIMDNYNTSTGTLIQTSNQYGFCAFIGLGSSDNYLNFQSLEVGPVGGSLKLPVDTGTAVPALWGGGIECQNGSLNNILVSNCYFHGLGYWFNQQPISSGSIAGAGISMIGFTNLTITNCEFTGMQIACEFGVSGNSGNLTVCGTKFHDSIVWCIDLAVRQNGATLDNVFIHDNQFYNYDQKFGSGGWQGYGGAGSWPHCDGIFHRGDAVSTFTEGGNININNNNFYDTAPFSGGGTASIYLTGSTSANIYNNVFNRASAANGAITITDPDIGVNFSDRIYNNTFYCDYSPQIYLGGKTGGNWPVTNSVQVDVRNNIFRDIATGSGNNFLVYLNMTNSTATNCLRFDYNDYQSLNLDHTFMMWQWVAGEMSLVKTYYGDSTKTFGWEQHGTTNPAPFLDATNGDNGYLNDYHLTSDLTGTNLSSTGIPGLLLDRDGKARPSTNWSMGAYQFFKTTQQTVSNTVVTADLAITETVNSNSVAVGNSVVFSLQLQNNGPGAVPAGTNLSVTDQLPSALTYVSSSGGAYNPTNGLWTISTGLAANTSATLTITARASVAGVFTNSVSVAVPAGITDGTLANNAAWAGVTITNAVVSGTTTNSNPQIGGGSSGGFGSGGSSGSGSAIAPPPPPSGVKIINSGG